MLKLNRTRIDEIKEIVDNVYARLEYLEKILARAKCKDEDAWKYTALDIMEQIYDRLSEIRRKLDSLDN